MDTRANGVVKLLDELDFSEKSIENAKSAFKHTEKGKRGPFYKKEFPWKFNPENKDLFELAVWQGYLDASRTFSGIINTKENRDAFNNLAENMQQYFTQDKEFLHAYWCNTFIEDIKKYNECKIRYGQAQKVLNMAFKYLYCCEDADKYSEKFDCCHMPLDQFTLAWLFLQSGTWYQEWSWFDKSKYNEAMGTIWSILHEDLLGKELVIWQRFSDKNHPIIVNLKEENK